MARLFTFAALLIVANGAIVPIAAAQNATQNKEVRRLLRQSTALENACQNDAALQRLLEAASIAPGSANIWSRLAHLTMLTAKRQAPTIKSDTADRAWRWHTIALALEPFSSEVIEKSALWYLLQDDLRGAEMTASRLHVVCAQCSASSNLDKRIELHQAGNKWWFGSASKVDLSALDTATVRKMQLQLDLLGFNAGGADGRFGKGTLAALNRYLKQSQNGGALSCQGLQNLLSAEKPVAGNTEETTPASSAGSSAE